MAQGEQAAPRRQQRYIQSIEVGFRLMEVLERARAPLPLKTVAERAGMPASKAHLYMVSFSRLGLVAQDPISLRYGLGPYTVQLGLAGLRQLDILRVAHGNLERLQGESGLSVHLSVWGNMGPAIVAKIDGELEVPLAIKVGHVLPLASSATGRVFLACLPRTLLDPVLKQSSLSATATARLIEAARARLHEDGIAVSDSQVFDGFSALAAPVFDHSGGLAGSVTLLGLRSRVDLTPAGPQARLLKAASHTISQALGSEQGPGPDPGANNAPRQRRRLKPSD